jgi:Cdc37 N terminal kinase binding
MPVDYSKWDALELSDDSDFEEHPNIHKPSFIRAKQAQIHQQRAERKSRIATLKYERLVNVCLSSLYSSSLYLSLSILDALDIHMSQACSHAHPGWPSPPHRYAPR